MPIFILLAIVLLLIYLTWQRMLKLRKAAGVKGWVRSQDLDGRGRTNYVNTRYGVMCKPDILTKDRSQKRVVEYKSGRAKGNQPWPGHLLQLAAEMIATGAAEGELQYGDGKKFVYDINHPEMRKTMKQVVAIMSEMRRHIAAGSEPKATPSAKKCAICTFGKECVFSLA